MRLNDYFDKIICINLEKRKDKWNDVYTSFVNLGIEVERFSAFDCDDFKSLPYRYDKYGMASVACALSHIAVLKSAVGREFNNVLILEDDAEFVDDFNVKFDQISKQIPTDWNMLYLGAAIEGSCHRVSENILKCDNLLTTHAYAVNSSSYDILIRVGHDFLHGIDKNYTSVQKHLNCYVINPPLVSQKDGYSDLQFTETNYSFLKMEYNMSDLPIENV